MNSEINAPDPRQDLFVDEDIFKYEYASSGQRFLNYLIDWLLMNYGIGFLTGLIIGFLLSKTSPDFYFELMTQHGTGFYVGIIMITFLNFLIYYTFCEKVFRGYTLGKLITGTRVIREDGGELTWKNAILRSLSRLVPFEPLSIWFGEGLWHDTWTKTMVIKSR